MELNSKISLILLTLGIIAMLIVINLNLMENDKEEKIINTENFGHNEFWYKVITKTNPDNNEIYNLIVNKDHKK